MAIVLFVRAFFSLLSWAILGGAVYLAWRWYEGSYVQDADGLIWHTNGPTWWLILAAALTGWSFMGRSIILMMFPKGEDEPREERSEGWQVTAPDGSRLHVEQHGLPNGPTLVLTHGWGLDSTAWWYAKRELGRRFRIIVWDLPGLGRSTQPADGTYTIDRMAQALGAVVGSIKGNEPIVLAGHSIGGMITQTFWRAAPPEVRARVAGLALINTTYRNPLHTMWLSRLWLALRWPVIEPMLRLQIALWPLYWLSNWQSYLSGWMQLATRVTSFGRFPTRGQIDFSSRLSCENSPAVQAKGDLAMFRWDVLPDLPKIDIPVLTISGEKDIITLPEASETITNAVPTSSNMPMPGCGHLGMLEGARSYNAALALFAEGVLTARPVEAEPVL